ncbi:MAG: glycosyltransferase [Desulfopila sp.]
MNLPAAKQPDSWTFFDKIYCISLDNRGDRREQAHKEFEKLGILERVEFVIVAKHPTDREQGIFQSHMECLKRGIAAGGRNILVFEDDVFFQRYDAHGLRRACTSLASITWNGFFLGCITDGSMKTTEKNLVKIHYRTLAHAYALNRPFAETLVQETWAGVPFDEFLRRRGDNFYALSPMCAFQGCSGTDNQRVAIDRMRRIFGGLPFIQKTNELYHNHRLSLLCATVAFTVGGILCVALAIRL